MTLGNAVQLQPHTDLKPYFRVIADVPSVLDWHELFGNDNPVELDVGSGRGLFLCNASVANPDINYVGLEIDYREGRRAAKRLQKRESSNARVIGGDCRVLLEERIVPASVAAVHVYFPDPWWKKRHHKRRLFTDSFVDLVHRVLHPGGLLHCWTDVEDYFTVVEGLMNHEPRFHSLEAPEQRVASHDMDYQTSFERKKRKDGLPIYRGLWKKHVD